MGKRIFLTCLVAFRKPLSSAKMLPQKRPFEEEVVDDGLDKVLLQSEDEHERQAVCDLDGRLDEVLSQALDMIEEAMDGGYHGHVQNWRPLC